MILKWNLHRLTTMSSPWHVKPGLPFRNNLFFLRRLWLCTIFKTDEDGSDDDDDDDDDDNEFFGRNEWPNKCLKSHIQQRNLTNYWQDSNSQTGKYSYTVLLITATPFVQCYQMENLQTECVK